MKLFLHREDLLPEFENVNCSETKFEHFREYAKQAILACGYGGAKFIGWPERGENYQYNLIFPPRVTIEIPATPEEHQEKRILP